MPVRIDATVIPVIEGLVLDVVRWFKQRQADGVAPPTDEQVFSRVRAKIQQGDAEGEAWLREHPDA